MELTIDFVVCFIFLSFSKFPARFGCALANWLLFYNSEKHSGVAKKMWAAAQTSASHRYSAPGET
jgi:hypothetical protein